MQRRSRRGAFSAAMVQAVSDMTYVLFLLAFCWRVVFGGKTTVLPLYIAPLNVYLLPVLCPFFGPPPSIVMDVCLVCPIQGLPGQPCTCGAVYQAKGG